MAILPLISACTQKNDLSLPHQQAPEFSSTGQAHLPDYWWEAFDDPLLAEQINEALQNNFTLLAGWERLQAARSLAQRQAAELYPSLDIDAGAQKQIPQSGDTIERFSIGPQASFEVDLWGRIRSQTRAEKFQARATKEDYKTLALSLSAETALIWINWVEAHKQLDLLKRQLDTNEKTLKVLKLRFGAGQVRSEDILRQRLLIETLREDILVFETRSEILKHQLAVLQGRTPQEFRAELPKELPALPALPATGVPAELISRRPDIRQAFWQVQSEDQELAAAIRNRYPRLTLSASYISEAASPGNLFSNWLSTLAGSFLAPIIDGGERRAEISRRQSLRAASISEYGQTVLSAFQEVEDALVREEKQKKRITNLTNRLSIARETYNQIQTGYFNGVNDYIAVLDALDELQQTERNLLSARRNLIEFRIALYRALAGGFQTPHEIQAGKESAS